MCSKKTLLFHYCVSLKLFLFTLDEPPNINSVFVPTDRSFGNLPYFLYWCKDDFKLYGSERVHCDYNHKWVEEFPICKPKVTCNLNDIRQQQTDDIKYSFYDLYGNDINATAMKVIKLIHIKLLVLALTLF